MKIFRPSNIFTGLAVALAVAFVFRLVNVATLTGSPDDIGITTPANAGGFSSKQLNATPPEDENASSQEELDKKLLDAANKPADAAPAASGGAAPSSAPVSVKDDNKSDAMPPPPEDAGNFSASEVQVLQSLSKRRADLDKREKSLAEREALLSAAEQEVDHKITELNKLKGELEKLLGQQEAAESKRLDNLVEIYAGMKPKEAAAIFNTLDMDVLMQVVGKMTETETTVRKVGPILAAMDPEKARLVTIRLMQQRELPGGLVIKKAAQEQGVAAPVH